MTLTRPSLFCRLRSANNTEIWKEFAATYSPILQEYAQAYGRCDEDQRDIVQTVWVTLCRLLPQFHYQPQRGKFRHLLRRIVKNTAIDWGRRQRNTRASSLGLEQIPCPRCDSADSSVQWGRLQKCLAHVRTQCTPNAWHCFERHVLQRESAIAVGGELGLTANAVYINSSRVLDRVRQVIRTIDTEGAHD